MTIERTPTTDTDRGIPAYQVRLSYSRNYTVMQSGIAGSVSAGFKAWMAEEYRTLTATDTGTLTAHLLAPVLDFETQLVNAAAAQTEANRRLDLYKTRREKLNVRLHVIPGGSDTLDLGDVISIRINRFGYDSGKLFRILGLQPDYRTGTIDLTLWG